MRWPVLLLAPLLAACGATASAVPSRSTDLTVFAAASLTDAFGSIKTDFEAADPGVRVTFNFAGSPTLRTQLAQGARADVFASADSVTMDSARTDGSIAGQPNIFAHNEITVVVPALNPRLVSLQDLASPGAKIVIEQASVPAGNYARQALDRMSQDPAFGSDFGARVMGNVVSQEPDVRSVLSRIQLGEADAGLLYVSDAAASAGKAQVRSIPIPDRFNVVADYPLATVKNAPNPDAAKAFVDYVLSPAGQASLARWGLIPAS